MPHFIVETSPNILKYKSASEICATINEIAEKTTLFNKSDIKVRLRAYEHYLTGGKSDDFIHVFAYIMEGRNTEQKSNLSKQIVSGLKKMMPQIAVISANIMDFEKATYCNKGMVD